MTITRVHSIERVPAARRRAQCSTSRASVWSAHQHRRAPLHVHAECDHAAVVVLLLLYQWLTLTCDCAVNDCVNSDRCFGCYSSVAGVRAGAAGGAWLDSPTMLTFVFAVWSVARALGWACEPATSPEAEEVPVLPRLRSARASSDLSTLSATTTSSSLTCSSENPKRST